MAELRPPLRRSPGANRSAESAGRPRLADASAAATPGRCRAAVVAALELATRGLRPVGAMQPRHWRGHLGMSPRSAPGPGHAPARGPAEYALGGRAPARAAHSAFNHEF
jgi:hypothetical protein